MSKHTPGQLGIGNYPWSITADDDTEVAQVNAESANHIEDARRFVAAWNECACISTSALEAGCVTDMIALTESIVEALEGSKDPQSETWFNQGAAILAKLEGQASVTKPRLVAYDYYCKTVIYRDGQRVWYGEHPGLFALAGILGFSLETHRVDWHDMPQRPGHSEDIYDPPESLAFLQQHLAKVELRKLKESLQGAREHVAELEKRLAKVEGKPE